MPQTDRQTDKAIHWNSGIFDVNENWEKLKVLPSFVKEVHTQLEICPTTGREHYQTHVVCHRQVRLSQMCAWIKSTNWKPVIGDEYIKNSIAYCSKKESAVPGTQQVIKGDQYYQIHQLLELIAKELDHACEANEHTKSSELEKAMSYETLTSRMVSRDVKWVNRLCNPILKKQWEMYKYVFLGKMEEHLEETGGAYIIEGPASEEEEWNEYSIE